MKNENIKQIHTIQRTHIKHNSLEKKKKAFTFVDVSMVVTVQSCGAKKHQVKIVIMESNYSTVKDHEHRSAKSG